ncbi:MAG: TatD family hydrolase [Peptostreptococcaceae bacterium]
MYIDAHSHLDFFNENIEKAIDDINKNKILTLAMSMDVESYLKNIEYSKKSKYIKPCFGIHPWKAHEFNEDLNSLIPYIKQSEIIGEIGLDYVWVEDVSTYKKQRKIFNYILKESIKLNKVVNLHTKGAEIEIYNILKYYNYNKVIIHWYSGDLETLDKYIKLGCYFTIGVDIGYSPIVNEILNKIPVDKILVETDGPTALEWVNGDYGYPNTIKEVLRKVSEYKKLEINTLNKFINDNYNNLLNI